jgi:peptide/nickel transport system permease protein
VAGCLRRQAVLINALPGGSVDIAGVHIDLPGGDNGVLHGDLGFSIIDGRPVADVIGGRIVPTFILAGTAYLIWITMAFLVGVYAAVKRYSLFDSALTVATYVFLALPAFWFGIMLISMFAAPPLRLFPVGGMWSTRTVPAFGTDEYWQFFGAQPLSALWDLGIHLFLPVLTLVLGNIAYDSRYIRSAMLDSLNRDFVRTARAKGLSERSVIYKHALRNALLPVVTNMSLEIPFLFTGAIVVETVFSWPGMGRQFILAVDSFDYPVLMGILMVTSVIVVFANLVADVLYAVVDPRIQFE